jgi:hypothetical protein
MLTDRGPAPTLSQEARDLFPELSCLGGKMSFASDYGMLAGETEWFVDGQLVPRREDVVAAILAHRGVELSDMQQVGRIVADLAVHCSPLLQYGAPLLTEPECWQAGVLSAHAFHAPLVHAHDGLVTVTEWLRSPKNNRVAVDTSGRRHATQIDPVQHWIVWEEVRRTYILQPRAEHKADDRERVGRCSGSETLRAVETSVDGLQMHQLERRARVAPAPQRKECAVQ